MSRRRRRPAARPSAAEVFWGTPAEEAPPAKPIRPTPDPAAVPRSLGDPPLGSTAAAAHHLAVVYEEAVRAATALAAANGLLEGADEDSASAS